jgi:hypothetical protein
VSLRGVAWDRPGAAVATIRSRRTILVHTSRNVASIGNSSSGDLRTLAGSTRFTMQNNGLT